jgi:hypothetical protein
MVTVIKVANSAHRIFNYNENKVKEGVAACIGAENYPLDANDMSLKMKLDFLLKRMELNENVKRNSLHISLNFDPSESDLSGEKLIEIAKVYMQKLGFGEQPYLVYQHHDAGHPHLHVVTTNIEADGKRIDLHHLGIRKSEPARKAIEKEYGLVVAEEQKRQQKNQLKPVSVAKALYGKSQTKLAIQNVLQSVLSQYRYTSLPELNAVLKQYQVLAQRGNENSRVYQHKGLLYRILDIDGNPVGVPIKASLFYNKPTLQFLEKKFKENVAKRMPYKARIKNAIDLALLDKKTRLPDLIKALKKQGIDVVLRQNKEDLIYGITYVDHQTKCVFNGSALGKQYSAKAIQERCLQNSVSGQMLNERSAQKQAGPQAPDTASQTETKVDQNKLQPTSPAKGRENILDALVQPEYTSDFMPYQLKGKKKKRKRKNLNNNQ